MVKDIEHTQINMVRSWLPDHCSIQNIGINTEQNNFDIYDPI